MKKALITTLGMIGKDKENKFKKAHYAFDKSIIDTEKSLEYVNVFPLFIELFSSKFDIIPLYTTESLNRQKETLEYHKIDFDIEENGIKIDENEPNNIFNSINKILLDNQYSNIFVDVTHGFRSIPILTTINMIIAHFQNNKKIGSIIYAQEDFQNKGHYKIKDLKEYLEISNISFILTTFEKNYTVANHIESKRYPALIESLNSFSNDLMALSLNNLFEKSSKTLIKELDKIDNISVKKQAKNLQTHIKNLIHYNGKKRFEIYYDISKDLFEKNYMLLSLSLLFESIRMYIKTTIKKEYRELVEKVEKSFDQNLYYIGDFFIKFKNKKYEWKEKIKFKNKEIEFPISKDEFKILKNAFPKHLKDGIYKEYPYTLIDRVANTRNNLAHANSDKKSFKDIKDEIGSLLEDYHEKCVKDKSTSDLINHFNN